LWKLDACVKTRVLVDRVCLMTTLKKCERLFSEVTCKSVARASRELDVPKISGYILNCTRCDWCRPLQQQTK